VTAESGLPRAYFEELYRRKDDPWSFESRWYEARKRAMTLALLPRRNYGRALELGCSTGLVTTELAARAETVVAIDISQTAVDVASTRLAAHQNVRVVRADLRDGLPAGPFDLILISEVAYYLSRDEVIALAHHVRERLAPEGDVVLCHWRWPVTDYPLGGDDVHALLGEQLALTRLGRVEEQDVLLEVFSADPRSVATREGLR
jgi:SAM-dependent methyltransferase